MASDSALTRSLPSLPRVRLESPDALFAPDHQVQLPVPGPLYLLSCLQLPVASAYPTDENGLVADDRYTYQAKEIVYPDGSRFEASISGHRKRGLPSVYDMDALIGTLALADAGLVDDQGRVIDPSYSRILSASRGEPLAHSPNRRQIDALKRAFSRWAGTTVQTTIELNLDANGVSGAEGEPLPVRPRTARERETSHWILEYDVERELVAGTERDSIHRLWINPVWLGQNEVGLAAWLNPGAFSRMQNATMRALYLRLVVDVAHGWRPSRHVRMLDEWLKELGVTPNARAAHNRDRFSKALDEGRELGVIDGYEIREVGRGQYQVDLMPGTIIDDALFSRRIGSLDPVRTRVLLHHLQRNGFAPGEAHQLLETYGLRVQEVLRRVYYQRTVRGGLDAKGKLIGAWHFWIGKALKLGWTFQEPEYQQWMAERTERLVRPSQRELPLYRDGSGEEAAAGVEASSVESPLPDDVWGRTLQRVRSSLSEMAFRGWLRPTWLEEVDGDRVVVGTANALAPDWITHKHGKELEELLSDELGRPVRLTVRVAPSSGPSIPPS